jgi:hypothetical protein
MQPTGKFVVTMVIIAGIFLIFSGCTSSQKDLFSKPTLSVQQSPAVHSPGATYQKYRIRFDPISDYKTDSSFNITGSSILNVTGTTDFPAGTILNFAILEENNERDLIRTTIEVKGDNSGPNSFSYSYDMKGNPPARYRVLLSNYSMSTTGAFSRFNITSDIPYYKWIQMNPISDVQQGDIIPVSGTTDLPPGSEIMIHAGIVYHSCTLATPDLFGARSFCGGSCRETGSANNIRVIEGSGGINTWNSTVDTSNWCSLEAYGINAIAVNWTNVTSGGQPIRFKNS